MLRYVDAWGFRVYVGAHATASPLRRTALRHVRVRDWFVYLGTYNLLNAFTGMLGDVIAGIAQAHLMIVGSGEVLAEAHRLAATVQDPRHTQMEWVRIACLELVMGHLGALTEERIAAAAGPTYPDFDDLLRAALAGELPVLVEPGDLRISPLEAPVHIAIVSELARQIMESPLDVGAGVDERRRIADAIRATGD